MFPDLERQLTKLGFSDKETKVYLALLASSGLSIQEVSQKTGVSRASCYDILETLQQKGLVVTNPGLAKQFIVESPTHILTLLKLEEHGISSKLKDAERLVPELVALYNPAGERPRVRYLEGIEGLRVMQKEYELLEGDIEQIVGYDAFLALQDPRVTEQHRDQIITRKVRAIVVAAQKVDFPALPNVQVRWLSPDVVPATGEMSLCGDRVLFLSYVNAIMAVEIKSIAIAQTCRATFELAWKQAGEIEKTLLS